MRRCPASDPGIRSHRIRPCGTLASVVRTWSAWSPAASASISTASGTNFPGTRKRFDEAKRQHYAALYAQPGAMRAGFAQFLAFSQDAADNRTFLAPGQLR